MWEIWARAEPWKSEITADDANFLETLRDHVTRGERPDLPSECDAPPDGYAALMVECWTSNPSQRPTFAVVAARLAVLTPHAAELNVGHNRHSASPIYE